MKLDRGPIPVDFARELVEEALDFASRNADAAVQTAFREERDAIQSIETVDIRQKSLDALDSHWMERLQVAEPLESVLARHPGVEDLVSYCFLKLARAKEDERAYLHSEDDFAPGIHGDKPALVVQLTADTLLALDKLEPLLRSTLARAHRGS